MVYNPVMPNMKLTAGDLGVPDYMNALRQGMAGAREATETAFKPKTMAEALLGQQLQNKINIPRAEHAEEFAQADLKSKLAQAARSQQLASQPFGGMLSGVAKEAYGLELLKNKYGEDNPLYQMAKNSYDTKARAMEGLTNYRENLAQTAGTRSLSSFGKLQQEEADADAGFEPGTNRQHQISPERREELLGQYALLRQKAATDADTRKRTLLASNIDKTINTIKPSNLTRFAGLNGAMELRKQEVKAATNPGTESEEYRQYLEAANNAKLLSKQVRQFYGDSIQPSMLENLEKLANPSTWKNNPEIATRLYKSFTNLLKQETGTYRSALKSTKEYQGTKPSMRDPLGLGL